MANVVGSLSVSVGVDADKAIRDVERLHEKLALVSKQLTTAGSNASFDKVATGLRNVDNQAAKASKSLQQVAKAQGSVTKALGAGTQELFVGLGAARSGNYFYALAAGSRYLKNFNAQLGETSVISKLAITGLVGTTLAVAALGTALGAAGYKLARFGIEQAANLEMLNIQLTGLLGSAEKAQTEMNFLLQLGKESIVPTQSLIEADRLMLAFGVTADNTRRDLVQFMSDFGTATGATQQQVYFLSLALGQVASFGKANTVDMRQLANAGINTMQIYEIIGKSIGKSAQEVAAGVSEGLITADRLFAALSEYGTGFAETAERARNSTQGLLANIKDEITTNIGLAFAEVNTQFSGFLKSFKDVTATIDFKPLAEAVSVAMQSIGAAFGGGTAAGTTLKDLMEKTLPAAIRGFGAVLGAILTPIVAFAKAVLAVADAVGWLVSKFIEIKPLLISVTTLVGLLTIGYITQKAELILLNVQYLAYITRVGLAGTASKGAAGFVGLLTSAFVGLRTAVTLVLGPLGVVAGILGAGAVATKNAYDAGQQLNEGTKTVTETMTEQSGVLGFLAIGFSNVAKVIDHFRGSTETTVPPVKELHGELSGTVAAAIAAGNAMGPLAAAVEDAGDAAWYASQSYLALWQSILLGTQAQRDYNSTSGTVSSAIQQGVAKGPDQAVWNKWNELYGPKADAKRKAAAAAASSAASKELTRMQELLSTIAKVVTKAMEARDTLRDMFTVPFGPKVLAGGGKIVTEAFKAFTSSDISTIVGQYKTLRQAIADFYSAGIVSGGKFGKSLKDKRKSDIDFLKRQTGELVKLASEAEAINAKILKVEEKYQEAIDKFDKRRSNLQAQFDKQQAQINNQYDGYYTATSMTTGRFYEGSIAIAQRALDTASAAYDKAKEKLDELKQARDEFMQMLKQMAITFVNDLSKVEQEITRFTRLDAVGSFSQVTENIADTRSFTQGLRDRLIALRNFVANVKTLIAKGLDQSLVQQILTGGPGQNGALAAELANASQDQIGEINTLQSALNGTINDMQQTASAAWYDAGIAAQEAFTAPLKAAMDSAQTQVTELNRQKDLALGILNAWYADQNALIDAEQEKTTARYEEDRKKLEEALAKNQKAAETVAAAIDARFKKLPTTAYATGLSTIDGIVKGLSSSAKIKELKAAAQRIADIIQSTIKSALKVKSPSQVMVEVGENVGQGLAIGMGQSEPLVSNASMSLANAAVSSVTSSAGTGTGNTLVKVYIGDKELTDLVDLRIEASDADSLNYVSTGRRF